MSAVVPFNSPSHFSGQYVFQQAEPAKAFFVFAHGAGADMNHEFMQQVSELLVSQGISVLRFNFPYMDKRAVDGKRRPPDRMPALLDCYQSVIDSLATTLPLFIGGKSMGSRVAATLVGKSDTLAKAAICLGYPFHPAGKPEKLRLEPLQESKRPILIVQGDRDTLGNSSEIADYSFSSHCRVSYLTDGDHSFKPRVKSGVTLNQNIAQAVAEIVRFIDEE